MPAMPVTVERRRSSLAPAGCEVRKKGEASVFVGRAVVYNAWSELLYSYFRERIAPGAFDESLRSGRELFCTVDHDPSRTLGRTSSETLRIEADSEGIGVECDMADYSYARDLRVALDRGDLQGMSFIMDVKADVWERPPDGARGAHRTIIQADLYEVAFVFLPAYTQTEADLRGVPIAFPVAGEQKAIAEAKRVLWSPSLSYRRRRMQLAEAERR